MPFTARQIRIGRKTLVGDTFASLGVTEKIAINALGQDNSIANMWSRNIHTGTPTAVAEHPNPNENLAEQQDTGLDEDVYRIEGVISRADLIGNQFLINLETWNNEGKDLPALPFGRFFIELDRAPLKNKDANATDGLIFRLFDVDMDEDIPNQLDYVIEFSRGEAAS